MSWWRRIQKHFEPRVYSVTGHGKGGFASVIVIYGRNARVDVRCCDICPRCPRVEAKGERR